MALQVFPPEDEGIEAGGVVTLVYDNLPQATAVVRWSTSGGTVIDPTSSVSDPAEPAEAKWDTSGLEAGSYELTASVEDANQNILSDDTIRYSVRVRPLSFEDSVAVDMDGDGPINVALQRIDFPDTVDQSLWPLIRKAVDGLSFKRYQDWVDKVVCGTPSKTEQATLNRVQANRSLPFPDIDPYRLLKVATEVFLMINCGVALDRNAYQQLLRELNPGERERLGVSRGSLLEGYWQSYLQRVNGFSTLPYLDIVRRKLGDVRLVDSDRMRFADRCYGILREKFTRPCLLELIWSYWQEEGMLVQTLATVSLRFQNRRIASGQPDPLAQLEIDPLRPLSNLLWGYIQDEQHRLTVARRAYEYSHHYGISLYGKAVPALRPADSRSRFLEAFHNLLHKASIFYKEDDDTTMIADPFPVLNSLREVHLLLAEGAHNQYGDLPWTARQEMLMQQWLIARPEFREFLPTRVMVVYPEPWMDRVDAMKKVQGWTDTSVRHFRDLAVTGEPILLSIRFGNWSDVMDRNSAANWARYWRPEVQWYIQAYQAVTGIDLSSDVSDVRAAEQRSARFAQPALHLSRRLAEQRSIQRVRV